MKLSHRVLRVAGFDPDYERETLDQIRALEGADKKTRNSPKYLEELWGLRRELWEKYAPEQWQDRECLYRLSRVDSNAWPYALPLTADKLVWVLNHVPLLVTAETLIRETSSRIRLFQTALRLGKYDPPIKRIVLEHSTIGRTKTAAWPYTLLLSVLQTLGLDPNAGGEQLVQGPAWAKFSTQWNELNTTVQQGNATSWAAASMAMDEALEILYDVKRDINKLTFRGDAQLLRNWVEDELPQAMPKNPFEPLASLEELGFELVSWNAEGPQLRFLQSTFDEPFPTR